MNKSVGGKVWPYWFQKLVGQSEWNFAGYFEEYFRFCFISLSQKGAQLDKVDE